MSLPPSVTFRRAELADMRHLAQLRRPDEAGGASEDRMRRYLAGEHHPQLALAPRAMWVAVENALVVGYVAGHLTRRYGCDGELQWIYVSPAYRRAHIATELLRLLAAWFLEHRAHRVCVDVGDEDARPFYNRHGAEVLNQHWMVWSDLPRALR